MAEYNISKLVLPNGDVCKITDTSSGWVRDVEVNNTSVVLNQVANIPYASSSAAGVVSTDAQTFAGTKTFIGNPRTAGGVSGGALTFASSTAPTVVGGSIQLWHTQTNNVYRPDRFYFVQKSYDSSTGAIIDGGSDQYRLPAATPDKTNVSYYSILTTKDFNSLNFKENGVLLSNENIDTDLEYGITYYTQNNAGTQALSGTKPPISSGMKIIQYNNYYSTANYDIQFATSSTAIWMRFKTSTSVWGDWGRINSTTSVIPIEQGGTNATTASQALINLGAQATITGAATTVTNDDLTASRVLISNSSGKIAVSSSVTTTELGYLDGVTSAIQTQLDNKKPKQTAVSNPAASGDMVDAFVYSITQDVDGVISPVRRQVQAASDSQRGVVTTSSQSFAGQKTFISNPIIGAADATSGRLYLRDKNSTVFPAVCYNGNNFWLGKAEAASASYVGQTYINTGYDGSAGYPTIKVNVPNADNDGGNTYEVYHTGYKPSPADIGAKAVQTAVSDPTASGSGIEYIATISQNAQGVITATKSTVRSASDSQSGVVTTGNQTFAGRKTIKLINPTIYDGTGNSSRYRYIYFNNNSDNHVAYIRYDSGDATNITSGQFMFGEYSPKSTADTDSTGYTNYFYLPIVDTGVTSSSKGYKILTSKEVVTVTEGGTGKTNATDAMQSFIEALSEGTGAMSSGDAYMITGHASTPTTTTTFYRRKASNVRVGGLLTGRTLKVSLGSTSASTAFDGTANISDIGVSGTLAIGNGGTGATSASAARTALGVKATQTAVSSPSATEEVAYSFINTISQDTQGVITPTKKYLGTLSFSSQGIHLESGTNIDTGLTVGLTYYTANSTETQALTGTLPTTSSGMKIITFYGYSGSNYHRQFALGSGDAVYMRTRNGSSTWRDWRTFSLSDHTHSNYLGAVSDGTYYGMATPAGTDTVWIRTTSNGIIPYQSGGAGSGHCGLGTSSWRFATAYIDNIYGKLNGDCTGSSGSCTGNAATATSATTASKLGSATVGGVSTAPIYLNAGTATAMTDISLVRTTTTATSINAGNSNGSVKLYASTNRGLYDTTKSSWIIYYHVANDNVYVTKWKDIGSAYRPVYFDSNGAPVACNATTSLFSGTFDSSSSATTLTNGYANYNYLIIVGKPNSTATAISSVVVPTAMLTTSDQVFAFANENYGCSVKLKRSGTNNVNVTMTFNASTAGNGSVTKVYGGI